MSHLCGQLREFTEINDSKRGKLKLANQASTETTARGTVSIITDVNGDKKRVKLINVLHVLDLRENLLSVVKITDRNLDVTFRKDHAVVIDREENVKLRADRIGNLYYLSKDERAGCKKVSDNVPNAPKSLENWHRRLGHLNVQKLINTERSKAILGMHIDKRKEKMKCEVCLRGKMTRTPFPTTSEKGTAESLEIIHSDVCGPIRVVSKGNLKGRQGSSSHSSTTNRDGAKCDSFGTRVTSSTLSRRSRP